MRLGSLAKLAIPATVFGVGCSGAASTPTGPLDRAFTASAEANGVPRDLLIAISQTEGGLDMPRTRDVDPEAAVPVAGPLQLRHGKLDTLARGSALMHTTELALRKDADLALEAGARVLAEVGAQKGARRNELATWDSAIEEMSGYADDLHRKAYAHRVFALLARGGVFEGRDGERIALPPHDLPPSSWMEIDTTLHTMGTPADYAEAEWFPTSCTNKCVLGRDGASIDYVVIHDTEGGWDASVATLQNDPGKSVQYIVGTDGKVGQFVHESDTAWHAGNHFYNQRSVGIEHVGYDNKPYTRTQYEASAKLVSYLTGKYGVNKDRAHIVGHDQIPDGTRIDESSPACANAPSVCEASADYGGASNHRDPGIWEWATYMPRFGGAAKCNDLPGSGNVLTCSVDKTQAFRCTNGNVEVLTCSGGCVAQDGGVDVLCPQSSAGPNGGTDDAGAPPTPEPPAASPGDPTPLEPPSDPSAPPAPNTSGGGCSSAGSGPNGSPLLFFFGLLTSWRIRSRKKASPAPARVASS